jgi:hypothetical protein
LESFSVGIFSPYSSILSYVGFIISGYVIIFS